MTRFLAILFVATILGAMAPNEKVVDAQGDGPGPRVEISVHVPLKAYPENALVRVSVRLRNTSRGILHISRGCPYGPVWAQVEAQGGAVVYPPALGGGPPLSCPAPVWMDLRPGEVIRRQVYVILRRAHIRPVADLEEGGYVYGRPISLKLFRSGAPHVSLGASPQLHADIRPPVPVRGSLHYMEWAKCPGTGPGGSLKTYGATRTWQSTPGVRLVPGFGIDCGKGFEWHAVAGWLNQPVAYVDYAQR